jgi:hypothetical protein
MFHPDRTWKKTVVKAPDDPDDSARLNWLSEAVALAGASVQKDAHGVEITWTDRSNGATHKSVTIGGQTLRDAISAAMRDLPDPRSLLFKS